MVAGGRLGRKSRRGYYEYAEDGSYRESDPPPQQPESASGALVIIGEGQLAEQLRRLAAAAGYTLDVPAGTEPVLTIDARAFGAGSAPAGEAGGPVAVLCAGNSLAAAARGRDMVGFHLLPPLALSHAVELTRGSGTTDESFARARHFFHSIGKHTIEVGDAPGLVLGRIVCQLINEACFALQEGVASPADVDTGVKLGLNYPRGLFEWCEAIGAPQVFATIDALQREIGGDRYRPAANLRRAVLERTSLTPQPA
jgi:3-hydroxybutyryl-CoA dehydrogenase